MERLANVHLPPRLRDKLFGFGRNNLRFPCDPALIPLDQFPSRRMDFRHPSERGKGVSRREVFPKHAVCYMDEEMFDALNGYCDFVGVSKTHVMRIAIAAFLMDPPPRRFLVGVQYRDQEEGGEDWPPGPDNV